MIRRSQAKEAWLYTLPAILVISAVALYPLLQTFYFSFTDARLGTLGDAQWVGLENYIYLFQDPDWWHSVWNTLVFTFFSVSIELVLGLAIAEILNSKIRGRGALRASVLIPWAIPTVVSAKMWAWMFNDLYGVINELLIRTGLTETRPAWLADDTLSMVAVVAVDVWKTTPFVALLLLAGLQGIPSSVYEAARVDGVPAWRRFLHITLPLLKPAIFVTAIFRLLDALRIFDLPFVLTSNSKETMVMSVFARQQLISFQEVGYGSAASFLIFCVIGLIACIYLALGRKQLVGGTR